MNSLALPPPYSLRSSGGSDVGTEGMVRLVAEDYANRQAQARIESEQAKFAVGSLISSYNTTTSGAMRGHIVQSMQEYYNQLPESLRKQIEPYIRNGPISEEETKKREFLKHNPPPPEPELSLGNSKDVLPKFEQDYAGYLFAKSDHKRALDAFVFGAASVSDKLSFIPINESRAAIRNKDGQVIVLNKEDLQIKEIAAKYGISEKDVYLRGHALPTGSKGVAVLNGRRFESEEVINVWNNEVTSRTTNITELPGAQSTELPDKLTALLLEWKGTPKEGSPVAGLKELALKDPQKAQQELATLFPGWHFELMKSETPHFFGLFSTNKDTTLVPIKDETIIILKNGEGKEFYFYYDSDTDQVIDSVGQKLGNYIEVTNAFSKHVPKKKE